MSRRFDCHNCHVACCLRIIILLTKVASSKRPKITSPNFTDRIHQWRHRLKWETNPFVVTELLKSYSCLVESRIRNATWDFWWGKERLSRKRKGWKQAKGSKGKTLYSWCYRFPSPKARLSKGINRCSMFFLLLLLKLWSLANRVSAIPCYWLHFV